MKHVAFDLDGVLVDALSIHRGAFLEAWNAQVPEHPLDETFHDAHLASRNTTQKIRVLLSMGFGDGHDPVELARSVSDAKQALTAKRIDSAPATVGWLPELISSLKRDGRSIALVSNSVRATCERVLENIGVLHLFDVVIASDDPDVTANKPHATPYVMAAAKLGVPTSQVLAFEDSAVGARSAHAAGCWVCVVGEPTVDLEESRVRAWLRVLDDV